jgi:hypothetical protein
MKEIGGYFGLEQLISNEYHKGLIALNSGRNALLYILKARHIKKIYIPYLICDSVINILLKNGIEFEYYQIDADFLPIFHTLLEDEEYLYVVNYYGQLDNIQIQKLKQRYTNIILDNTHAFYQRPIDGIDTIYSCRKFFGVPDGAYLFTNTTLEEALVTEVSKEKMDHILGRYEGTAADYYHIYQRSENVFEEDTLKLMSKLTHNILGAIDYEKNSIIRKQNFLFLKEMLEPYNKINIKIPNVAFAYPLYIEEGHLIRKGLANKKIYIPTLWPNVVESMEKTSLEYRYAHNILPLPCDQRYDVEDMKLMVDNIIEEIINEH